MRGMLAWPKLFVLIAWKMGYFTPNFVRKEVIISQIFCKNIFLKGLLYFSKLPPRFERLIANYNDKSVRYISIF